MCLFNLTERRLGAKVSSRYPSAADTRRTWLRIMNLGLAFRMRRIGTRLFIRSKTVSTTVADIFTAVVLDTILIIVVLAKEVAPDDVDSQMVWVDGNRLSSSRCYLNKRTVQRVAFGNAPPARLQMMSGLIPVACNELS